MLADDGTRLWAAYRFSNGNAVMLRDGVLQNPDPATADLALLTVIGQRDGLSRVQLTRPPEALIALKAQKYGAIVTIADGTGAEKAILDALGGNTSSWRERLIVSRDSAAPNAELIYVPVPPLTRGLADRKALASSAARLQPGAAIGILFPPGTPADMIEAARRDAAAALGGSAVADLPKGVLVLGSSSPLRTDPASTSAALAPNLSEPFPDMAEILSKQVSWRSAPTAK
jgi:hypothetical protein